MTAVRAATPLRVAGAVVSLACLATLRALLGTAPAGLLLDALLALAAVVALLDARRRAHPGRSRIGWSCQAGAAAAWTVFPLASLAGLPWPVGATARLAFVLLVGTGWWFTSLDRDTWSRVRLAVDSALVNTSALVVGWGPCLAAVWAAHGGGLAGVVAVAIPLGTVGVAALSTGVAFTEMHRSRRLMPALVVAGLVTLAASDVAGGRGGGGFWAVGFALVVLATRIYTGTSPRREVNSTRSSLVHLPYLVLAPSAVTLVLLQLRGGVPPVEAAGTVALVALLLVRQHVTLVENRGLVERLAASERRLRHQATHDALTGLPGRVVLYDLLDGAMALHRAEGLPVAVVFLDLDDFKVVNDTLGHAAGDDVLVQTARRLSAVLAPLGDRATAVRMSGDEFAAVLLGDAAADATGTAHGILAAVREPMAVNGTQVAVGGSIGVAVAHDGVDDAPDLLRASDVAMYRVKHDGKGGVGVAGSAPCPLP